MKVEVEAVYSVELNCTCKTLYSFDEHEHIEFVTSASLYDVCLVPYSRH